MRKRKYKYSALTIDYWFLATIFLAFFLFILLCLLIKERQFLHNMQLYLEKYNGKIDTFYNFNAKISNGHLSLTTNPSSPLKIIYLTPETYSYRK